MLVTGGAGFIGSHLVDALRAAGARVRVLDSLGTGSEDNLGRCRGAIQLVAGDIRDADTCRRACEGMEVVFHQAALGSVPRSLHDPATTFAVNVQGTVNLLTAARAAGVRRVVYASSSSVYGDSNHLTKREGDEGTTLSPYAASKKMCEEAAAIFHRSYGLESVGLRYFNVYGPRQDPEGPYAAVIPRFFRAHLNRPPPVIYGDGKQSRDFTFVDDAVEANLRAATCQRADGRAYNVSFGEEATIRDLERMVAELTSSPAQPRHEPPRTGDVRRSLADLTASRAVLGYEPRVALAPGLARCLDYYRKLFGALQSAGEATR